MKIPTPKELLAKLQESELIDPIVKQLTEKICNQLYIKFHTETLNNFDCITINAQAFCVGDVSQVRCHKDTILEKIDSNFSQKGWLFTRYNITINNCTDNVNSNNRSEICFVTICEAKAGSL